MMKPTFEEFFIFFIIYLKQNNRKWIFNFNIQIKLIVFNIIRYYNSFSFSLWKLNNSLSEDYDEASQQFITFLLVF